MAENTKTTDDAEYTDGNQSRGAGRTGEQAHRAPRTLAGVFLDGLNLRRLRELNALRGDKYPMEAHAVFLESFARVVRKERGKQTDFGPEEWEQCFGGMLILLDRLAAEQGVDLAKAVARQFNAQSMLMKQGHFLVKQCAPGVGCEWE